MYVENKYKIPSNPESEHSHSARMEWKEMTAMITSLWFLKLSDISCEWFSTDLFHLSDMHFTDALRKFSILAVWCPVCHGQKT